MTGAKTNLSSGQALVEFAIALIVILAIFTGLIQIGWLADAHTDTMREARQTAGRRAMSGSYTRDSSPEYLVGWNRGRDGITYTADDIPFAETNIYGEAGAEISHAARSDEVALWRVPFNPFQQISATDAAMETFSLVFGSSAESVPTLPAIRSLIYGEEDISVKGDACLVWTGGIY